MRSCQPFHVDSEFERARHKVFNYASDNLNATVVDEKFNHLSSKLKCAAKVNPNSGFISKKNIDGGSR